MKAQEVLNSHLRQTALRAIVASLPSTEEPVTIQRGKITITTRHPDAWTEDGPTADGDITAGMALDFLLSNLRRGVEPGIEEELRLASEEARQRSVDADTAWRDARKTYEDNPSPDALKAVFDAEQHAKATAREFHDAQRAWKDMQAVPLNRVRAAALFVRDVFLHYDFDMEDEFGDHCGCH